MVGNTKKEKLYGSERESRRNALQLAKKLQASSVLGSGEYNYTADKLKANVWQTSQSRDFGGLGLDRAHTIGAVTQLNEHFRLGNDSGADVPPAAYRQSTTADDFTQKLLSKPDVQAEDRTVNWPDMAPQYRQGSNMGNTDYNNSFNQTSRSVSAPVYPKVKTAIMTLPLDPSRFHVQRGSEYKFGNDEKSKISEHQRAFGRVDDIEDFSGKLARGETGDVIKNMKALDRTGNVFRSGDYNDALGNKDSTTTNDFGPRTRPPGEVFSKGQRSAKSVRSDPGRTRATTDVPNLLVSYARDVTVPAVFSDADDTLKDQTSAHFRFGSCTDSLDSVYGKDFLLSSMAPRAAPPQAHTQDAGHMLQCDPDFSSAASSLKAADFMALPRPLNKMIDNNQGKKYVDHVNISLDKDRHIEDRQKSVAHLDYNKHPVNFHALPPFQARAAPYNYLHTDGALPYPGLAETSENSNNFSGVLMDGISALDRRRQKDDACRERAHFRKGTHFDIGYVPVEYTSESTHQFAGRKKTDRHVPPAGKREVRPESDFFHLSHSLNTQDLKHNDPYVVSTKEGLPARRNFRPSKGGNPFQTSVMKGDFNDLNRRSYTLAQVRMLEQDHKLATRMRENSHFFHTDNSGTDQFQSMSMHDFVKPDDMTGGRKFLAAR